MSEQTTAIISKVWGMCDPLRDDGVSYGDYLEQLTYLIFLKMSDDMLNRRISGKRGPGWLCLGGYAQSERCGTGRKV